MDSTANSQRNEPAAASSCNYAAPHVLFYTGYDHDRGGINAFLRALATANTPYFKMTLGVAPGWNMQDSKMDHLEFPRIDAETISPRMILRARTVARKVREWLQARDVENASARIFHGCSRAGLLVALWLARWGEHRACATVHIYGRHRWFYRHAARQLGARLKFLTPAMARYYNQPAAAQTWDNCLPPCAQISNTVRHACPVDDAMDDGDAKIIRVAGIGAFAHIKRWELVLEALARLPAAQRARWHFTHIGAPDGSADSARYEHELRARTHALGLDAQVRWLGQQSSSAPLLAETDVLIVPGERESFSLARIEALAAGVPSVSADSGGARDFISEVSASSGEPPVNGWLFRSGDASDLSRTLARISAPSAFAVARIDRDLLCRFAPDAVAVQHARFYAKLSA